MRQGRNRESKWAATALAIVCTSGAWATSDEEACPLAAVDRRLEDAHELWHQAENSYFDPNAFRLAAQNTVQTLRTVTFILQNHKHIIPSFAELGQVP